MATIKYKRIMLKLSGEVLLGKSPFGIDQQVLHSLCEEIAEIRREGVAVILTIGGGNIWRYRSQKDTGLDRVTLDTMGMLATVMNGIGMQNMFEKMGVECRVASAIDMPEVCEPYRRRKVMRHLEKGRVVVCVGGTGSPFFTTDSAATLRALELECQVLLKGTKVDGVYDSDPEKNPKAKKIQSLTYHEVLDKELAFMDAAAVSLAKEGNLPIIVFEVSQKGNIMNIVKGQNIGTMVGPS